MFGLPTEREEAERDEHTQRPMDDRSRRRVHDGQGDRRRSETNRILWQAYERHETRQAEKALEFL